jgi:segregation and condensation protein A
MTLKTDDYSVDLDVFQGPMDLLLYLIRKDEIDVYDIPIARITEQYMKYVEVLRLLNLENAGEYIFMAATLIRIKAQMLLPRNTEDEDEADPREELTRALLEYSKFKEAGEILREKREVESRLISVAGRHNGYKTGETILTNDTTLFDLLSAFHDVMAGFKEDEHYLVDHQDLTIEDRIEVIQALLEKKEFATFDELFADIKVKLVAILTFLAVLEMVRLHRIVVRQSVVFSELRIYRPDIIPPPVTVDEPIEETSTVMQKVAADS